MKRLVFSLVCTLALVGFVMADEFNASIKKVDGKTVHFTKGKKGEEQKEASAAAADNVKVAYGNKAGGGGGKKGGGKKGGGGGAVEVGDSIENGLKNEMFSKIDEKGINAQITTDDSGKITQILVFKGGKGGGGKKKG